jgi:hypothetical protein
LSFHLLDNIIRRGQRYIFPTGFIIHRSLIGGETPDIFFVHAPPHTANESDCHNKLLNKNFVN